MTREELHELVDIVMDARERTGRNLMLDISDKFTFWDDPWMLVCSDTDFDTFSDFTQAVNEYIKTLEPPKEFKKFWVVSVNNYLCDASYDGKLLKAKHRFPSFRKFHFIKSVDDLKHFTKRDEISNEDLVNKCLQQ